MTEQCKADRQKETLDRAIYLLLGQRAEAVWRATAACKSVSIEMGLVPAGMMFLHPESFREAIQVSAGT